MDLMRSTRSVLLISLLVALAACGGPAQSPASSPSAPGGSPAQSEAPAGNLPDSCDLLSVDEVSALMGEPAGDPSPGLNATGDDESFCEWERQDTTTFPLKLLQLQVFASTQYLSRDAYAGDPVQDVSLAGVDDPFAVVGDSDITLNYAVAGMRVVITYTPGDRDNVASYLDAVLGIGSLVAGRVG